MKTGNIYRKLDELNDTEGAAQRARIGLDLDKAKADDDGQPPELVDALGLCMLRMGAFNQKRMAEWAAACAGTPGCRPVAGPAASHLPSSAAEIAHFRRWLREADKGEHGRGTPEERKRVAEGRPKMFAGASYQVQSCTKWFDYLGKWLSPKENPSPGKLNLQTAARKLWESKTWLEANEVVIRLPGIGNFTGAQGLLRMLYGVFRGDTTKLFNKDFDQNSMKYQCLSGNGPVTAVQGNTAKGKMGPGLWGGGKDVHEAIAWLVDNADAELARLGLDLPYLAERDSSGAWQRVALTGIDMEHSLCYFSRLMRARNKFADHAAVAERLHELLLPEIAARTLPRLSVKEYAGRDVPQLSASDDAAKQEAMAWYRSDSPAQPRRRV